MSTRKHPLTGLEDTGIKSDSVKYVHVLYVTGAELVPWA